MLKTVLQAREKNVMSMLQSNLKVICVHQEKAVNLGKLGHFCLKKQLFIQFIRMLQKHWSDYSKFLNLKVLLRKQVIQMENLLHVTYLFFVKE